MNVWLLVGYVVVWYVVLAVAAYVAMRRSVWNERRQAALYMSFMAMFGPMGEILVGTLYQAVFGHALWQYEVYPIHHGYTSLYAPFIWAICGLQMWLMAPLMAQIKDSVRRYTVMAIDILAIEIMINALFLLSIGQMIFYYTPGELGHFSSLQTLPFYFVASLVAVYALRVMQPHARFASLACIGVTIVVVFLT